MRKLLQITLLVLLGLALIGCGTVSLGVGQLRGAGNITTETHEVGAFRVIAVSGVGEAVITQGDTDGLTLRKAL